MAIFGFGINNLELQICSTRNNCFVETKIELNITGHYNIKSNNQQQNQQQSNLKYTTYESTIESTIQTLETINGNTLMNTGIDIPRAKPDACTTTSTSTQLILTRTTTSDLRLRLRPPPPSFATDLHRPPLPNSTDLRYRPPLTSATDLHRPPLPANVFSYYEST